MNIKIEQAIHNLAVEGMTLDEDTLQAMEKLDKEEITFEQFQQIIFQINGVKKDVKL